MPLVVKSGVRELLQTKQRDIRISEKAWPAIEKAVDVTITAALMRCKANGRKTLQAQDF